eukprot:2769794-Prymnesium_polylepis.1
MHPTPPPCSMRPMRAALESWLTHPPPPSCRPSRRALGAGPLPWRGRCVAARPGGCQSRCP